ncbi:hypothetical protein [Ferrimonas marina]|uniref:Uncharacterized protein n=1 Tax=Ferrimonas marina TaxID=299255 RepID=A0A1M5XTD2_9GAMM|nr:hypothetical protein [Ferrimonas marina]SHI02972.1 hypothetical protein SAMN02745129_3678 [Ferrimonas marina]
MKQFLAGVLLAFALPRLLPEGTSLLVEFLVLLVIVTILIGLRKLTNKEG